MKKGYILTHTPLFKQLSEVLSFTQAASLAHPQKSVNFTHDPESKRELSGIPAILKQL
jgi:hypothetical protein